MGKPVRILVSLIVANLVAGATFAVLILVFADRVLAYQSARRPGTGHAALVADLWSRPIQALLFAVLYIFVIRGLLRGRRRAYRRVRIVSALGLIGGGYLLASGEYPGWLRPVQIIQVALAIAIMIAANRRAVRATFPADPPRPSRRRPRLAALTLIVLAPLVAEVTLGSTPITMLWLLVLYLPIYGAGSLVIREVVRRTGGGVPALLLLGAAYGLAEEGLALQSLTSPHLYGAAGWAPRLLGMNTAYTELNLPYHAVFSVLIPVLLVEMIFPDLGRRPYLRPGGTVAAGLVWLAGLGLLRASVPPSEDPGYLLPAFAAITMVALIAALMLIAVGVVPRISYGPASPTRPVPPAVVGAVAGTATLLFFSALWPLGNRGDAVATGLMVVAAAIAAAAGLTVRRWSAAPWWDGRHRLAAVSGALVAHTAFGLVAAAGTTADRVGLAVIGLAMVAALGRLAAALRRTADTRVCEPSLAILDARPAAFHADTTDLAVSVKDREA
jgi:hypothetical protein